MVSSLTGSFFFQNANRTDATSVSLRVLRETTDTKQALENGSHKKAKLYVLASAVAGRCLKLVTKLQYLFGWDWQPACFARRGARGANWEAAANASH